MSDGLKTNTIAIDELGNEEYLLYDTTRCKYWKYNDYGYIDDISQARIFSLEEAQELANAPGVKDLEIIKI